MFEEGYYYHIFNRGNNRENLFRDEDDCSFFLKRLKKHVHPFVNIYAFALLANHFHLMISVERLPDNSGLNRKFANLFSAHAKYINKKYDRTGSLFEKRFQIKHIDSESYFGQLVCYIHWNPQLHGLTNDFRTWNYSSFSAFLNDSKTNITREPVYEWFGDKENFIAAHQEIKVRLPVRFRIDD